jgi:hypothetical protein
VDAARGARGGRRHGGKSTPPVTLEEWAQYGIGEPDADGVYPDYRVPPELKPAAPAVAPTGPHLDDSWFAITSHWPVVVAELAGRFHVDLYDPAVRARPWPGVRTMIYALAGDPTTHLHRLLKTRG